MILTFGMSETTSLFLQEAARKRDFQVGSKVLPEAWQHGPSCCLVNHYLVRDILQQVDICRRSYQVNLVDGHPHTQLPS